MGVLSSMLSWMGAVPRKPSIRDVLAVWRPAGRPPVVYVQWFLTEWCNYRCPYCPQDHSRHSRKNGFASHAFDNHALDRWIASFDRHFATTRLSLKLTGGEPMMDRKSMLPLLSHLTEMPTLERIRVDTNATWDPRPLRLDARKVTLMCTFHPSQVTEPAFLDAIHRYRDHGYRIGMVNYVMTRESVEGYRALRDRLADERIPLHPNPLWDSRGAYGPEDMALIRAELPDPDWGYRTQIHSPLGKACWHPALAYQMNQDGGIHVACFPQLSGSFFDETLPTRPAAEVPCPAGSCVCLDMYSFLAEVSRNVGVDPLAIYSDLLLAMPQRRRRRLRLAGRWLGRGGSGLGSRREPRPAP